MDFKSALEKHILVLDGAMGTMVQDLNLSDAAFGGPEFKMLTDLLIFSRPDDLREIHLKYLRAGANIIETNTFGASVLRLREFDFSRIDPSGMQAVPARLDLARASHEALARHLNLEGGRIAREAIDIYKKEEGYDGRPLFVAGSIGPSNCVLSSTEADLKRTTFEEVEENNRVQVAGLVEGGADVILFETQQDILETKAALFGARRAFAETGRTLPVMVQVTVDGFSKMQIFNTDIEAAYVTMAGMGIDVFGINCNVGPGEMAASVEKMRRFSRHPVSVVPNAGQPVSEDGRTCYKLTPEAMADTLEAFVREEGVNIVGGCCGTTPAHIEALSRRVKGMEPKKHAAREGGVFVSGPQEAVALDSASGLVRIGERLNVRGSLKVREAVETERGLKMEVLEEVVREQVSDLGIDLIDVCMDSNIVETETLLPEVIQALTTDFRGAMCIDSFSVEALAAAIKVYPGRPIINSISLEEYRDGESKLDAVLKVTAGHGPVYIALVNGPEGPAQTADEKYELAAEIVRQAGEKFAVGPDQILIDVNAYPIGSEARENLNFCAETLASLPRIKAIHPDLKTTIGVGNLTNGLGKKPYMRQVLTSVFLDEARRAGLDCAILNPNHYVPLESLPQHDVDLARRVILKRDMEAFEELEQVALTKKTGEVQKKADYEGLAVEESICRKIRDGFKQKEEGTLEFGGQQYPYRDRIVLEAREALKRHKPLEFISGHLMKTMRELGDAFGRGEVSLPHLLKSADVMRNVMGYLEWHMRVESGAAGSEGSHHKGVVVLGTVYQDVHSIGKDLAKTLLENYGYRVVDLGVQVPLDRYIETARHEKADAIGMSALLVQTSNHMITVARMLKEENLDIPVLIGGAPVNRRHAGFVAMHGQPDVEGILDKVFYCESGMDGVNTMNTLVDSAARDRFIRENREALVREYQRAKGMREQEEKLLASLPRRKVSFKKHEVPRDGFGAHKVEFRLGQLASSLDNKSLYSLNWKYGKKSSWEQKGVTAQSLEGLKRDWLKKAEENRWIRARARFGLFPAQSEGDELIVYDPEEAGRELGRIHFSVCIGKGQKDVFSVAQYFHPKSSSRMDAVGLLITTSGEAVAPAVEEFKSHGDSESALFLQGLSDRVTEDLAEYIHRLMRRRLGHKNDRVGGQRYSPGYPALTGLINNRIIWEILRADDIAVRLTGSNEFDPPSTTAAVICFHSEAGYT